MKTTLEYAHGTGKKPEFKITIGGNPRLSDRVIENIRVFMKTTTYREL